MENAANPPTHLRRSLEVQTACGRMHIERNGFCYAGLIDTLTHRNSVMVCVSLTDAPFSVRTKTSEWSGLGAALTPPGHTHIGAGLSHVAILDVAPTDYNFRALARAAPLVQVWPRQHFASILEPLEDFRNGRMHRREASALHARFLELALQRVPAAKPLDPRVREVMRLLREEQGRSLAELADAVNMSVDWLRHLFVTEAGIPLRKYEMTLKLQAAAVHLQRDVSLSQVAMDSGFADLAHFSKIWKLHYGYAPRRAFNGHELAIDEIPWPSCFETTPPSAETQAVPTR